MSRRNTSDRAQRHTRTHTHVFHTCSNTYTRRRCAHRCRLMPMSRRGMRQVSSLFLNAMHTISPTVARIHLLDVGCLILSKFSFSLSTSLIFPLSHLSFHSLAVSSVLEPEKAPLCLKDMFHLAANSDTHAAHFFTSSVHNERVT